MNVIRHARPAALAVLALLVLAGSLSAQATVTAGLGLSNLKDKVAALESRTQAAEAKVKDSSAAFRKSWDRFEALPLTAAQARAAHEGKLDELPADIKAAIGEVKPAAAAHQAALVDYFDAYDNLSVTKMDVKVVEVIQELESTRTALAPRATSPGGVVALRALDKALAQMRKDASAYWDARTITHGPNSFKRLYALNDLSASHRNAELAVRKLQQKVGDLPSPTLREKLSKLRGKMTRVAANLKLKASMAPKVGRLLAYLAKPGKPDPDRMSDLMKELGGTYTTKGHVTIRTEGRERIPANKKLIFTPSHRQGTVDSMIMVQMMPGNFTPLMTFRYYPNFAKPIMGKLLEGEPGLIPVDLPNVDVVERAVETVKNGRALLIYPEGHVASPLGELRPLRNGIERICEKLLDEDVALVPVTLDDPAEKWGEIDYGSGDHAQGLEVRVVFDRPINPRHVYAVDGQLDGLLLNMIRETYHRNTRPALAPLAAPAKSVEKLEGEAEYREPLFEAVHEN